MKAKLPIGIIIVAFLIIIGVFFLINLGHRTTPTFTKIGVLLPNIDFEGTVVSLSIVGGEAEGGDITRPRDTAIVRIDKINSISDNFDWVSAGIEEGKEITIQFQYSARPAKIKQIFDPEVPTSSGDETPAVSATLSFTKENDYFVYSTKSGTITEETEKTLPGLEEAFKFKAVGWYGYAGLEGLTINEYEILP
ncbi:hypothetical protein HYW19_03050 [Candidatus Woesearchaeota archaeon]|nr:hypothetical protein [Candidatus Woesearchaeota archaeon]